MSQKFRFPRRARVIPRLRRDWITAPYADDPEARSSKMCEALLNTPLEVLQKMGRKRDYRPSQDPPYKPFAVTLTSEALRRLEQLEEMGGVSLSALAQEILSDERHRRK